MSDSKGFLILEDGSSYDGYLMGSLASSTGEVVFVTAMTGYQEVLTDPSYAGQIVVFTYPLIGNYGINDQLAESVRAQVAGCVMRNYASTPSHQLSDLSLNAYMVQQNIVGIHGVDTRAITRKLRCSGVMKGMIVEDNNNSAYRCLKESPAYETIDYASLVSSTKPYKWRTKEKSDVPLLKIVVYDCGLKFNILRILESRYCEVIVVPNSSTAGDILRLNPDGVVISPGPGDPSLLSSSVDLVRQIVHRIPTLGICLGHQLIAQAFGAKTFKLKFGHRGSNHPVQDINSGKVYITAQNHGYAVEGDSLPGDIVVTHLNLNDGTIEGISHRNLPVMSIQYHSEASPGPQDNEYIFDQFLSLAKKEDP